MDEKITARATPNQPKREANPEEYRKLRAKRAQRRQARRAFLKSKGHRPNRKMTKDKKTGADLREVR